MYGVFIIYKCNEKLLLEYMIVLSDWIDMKLFEVYCRLYMVNDWFVIKKVIV